MSIVGRAVRRNTSSAVGCW